jgi:tRNA pseudouridine13 synthase
VLSIPLPTARITLADDAPLRPALDAVLAEEGLTLPQMKIKGSRSLFFSKGVRPALCLPSRLEFDAAPDERHRGRERWTLAFELPRGSYATLLVKRLGIDSTVAPTA